MAYTGTRGAKSATAMEKDEDRQPRTPADLIAMSRGRAKPAAQQGSDHQPDEAGAAATDGVDELIKRVIGLNLVENSSAARKNIQTVSELKQELEGMCRTVFTTLGRQQKENAYQLALQIELELRGITVLREAQISVTYRDKAISSRRVDLLLTLGDDSKAIVEMKAVQTITKGSTLHAVHQLQYYLDVFHIDHGFLVNFPHDAGFPPPPSGGIFRQEPICGVAGPLSAVRVRERKGASGVGDGPEIVYFRRVS